MAGRIPQWRTSSYSGGGDCVEVAPLGNAIGVRDTKVVDSPTIALPPAAWAHLIARAGR
ncbi:DUF397 domain-containing protein [Embleya hyalina]|uniref:DUF397 domain-containing protein n=1 Tax=Embleya hyalina TaxID=516124 RepID=A0A401Z4Y2_9ACTN|nr:DUF397 domain-containing protein [Embleya hyalina]GCE01922.1 hypothetical protein EHYA_09697 [Embleya hyalina]